MARLRTIKPDFFRNDQLAELTPYARLLFIGLWTIADRRGVLEDRPKRIKADIFPYEDVDVEGLLNDLAGAGFIVRYTTETVRAIYIPTFTKHQNPHVKEGESDVPLPAEHQTGTVQAPDKNSSSRAGIVNGIHVQGMVNGLGVRESGADSPSAPKPSTKRNHRIPDDWQPSPSVLKVAKELHLTAAVTASELDKFRSHFLANGKTMLDWDQAAMNWLRRSLEMKPRAPTPLHRNGKPDFHAMAAELEADADREIIDTIGVVHESR